MSLLNDALRKKRSEQQPADNALNASLPKLNSKSKGRPKSKWQIIVCILVFSVATCGAWLYFDYSNAMSTLSTGRPPAGLEDDPLMDHAEDPTEGNAEAAPPTIASVKPTTLNTESSKAPESRTQKDIKPSPPKAQGTTKPKQMPVKAPSKVKASSIPKQKPAKTVPLKKTSYPKKPRSTRAKASVGNPVKRTVQSERLYLKARQYHRQNRIHDAIALYLEVIRIDPEHYKARFNLSAAYLQTEAYTQAYPIIADLYKNEPNNQQVMLNLAIAHIGCQRYPAALDLLNKADTHPDAPLFEIAFHKGVAFSHLNQAQDALNWYKRAEAIKPDDSRLLFNIAVVNDQQAQYGAAVDYYRRYLDQDPEIDVLKKKQVRQRIRALITYYQKKSKEKPRDEKTHR